MKTLSDIFLSFVGVVIFPWGINKWIEEDFKLEQKYYPGNKENLFL